MDFWSRLLAHTPLSPGLSRKDVAKDPVARLNRFEKEYGQLLQIWRSSSNLSRDGEAAEKIELRLQELTSILADESRRPLPHPCITFAATKQMYVPVAKIATTSYDEWIIKEAVRFFATLIESEEESFVESDAFSASLMNLLVRITGANSIRLARDTETKVVELAFNITTKIRLDPEILPAWFKSQQQQNGTDSARRDSSSHEKFQGRTQKQDFPLFYLLIDYIHHDGKMGDFARTGLLYIIEAASSSVALEQWIVESGLSTLMATGLGALYSQLSRKLVIDHPAHDLPPALAFSDYQHPSSTQEIVSSCSPDFQLHLETFLSHLLFWQDVLNHCRSVEVKQTLLEHFQVIFLQQLLYPSLLESSDIDGGSSVAVLTYLRRILESLDHPDMINLILHYLLALPDKVAPEEAHGRTKVSAARKRKSMDLATMMAAKAETATPLLFNLVDLILACLRSHNQQTVYVTLQLVSAILKRHHRYAVITLLRTEGTFGTASLRTVGAHQQEVDYLMALAGAIGGQDNFDELYHGILKDTTARLEAHPCSLKLIAPKVSIHNHKLPAIPDSLPGAPRDVRTHTLRPEDPLLNMVLDLLDTFFVNPVETNLALTEVILDLASCGYVVLEGWLLRNPAKYTYDGDGDGDDNDLSPVGSGNDEPPLVSQASLLPTVSTLTEELDDEASPHVQRAMQLCRRPPRWNPEALPRLLATLHTLVDQVEHYRASVPRFDDLLQLRREAFQTADAATAAPVPIRPAKGAPMATTPERRSMDEARSTTSGGDGGGSLGLLESSPSRPSGLEGFAQRILSELSGVGSQSSGSRSGSPRRTGTGGKEYSTPSKPLPVPPGALSGGYGLATPTTGGGVGPAVPPKEFPINYENPSRSGSGLARSYSPGTPFRGGEDAGIMSSPYGGGSLSPGFMPGSHRRRSKENEDPAVASQIAAFKAIDASILARVVGLPTPGSQQSSPARNRGESSSGAVEPIKIDFGRRPRGATGSEDGQWAGTSGSAAAQHSGLKQQESSLDIGPGSDVSTTSDGGTTTSNMGPEKRTATVSHVLTNVIILQGFLFELAALVQVRGGMFDEVRFV